LEGQNPQKSTRYSVRDKRRGRLKAMPQLDSDGFR
jgi:hypothetical protein